MHIWAFGTAPERTKMCTNSYVEIPCRIDGGAFFGNLISSGYIGLEKMLRIIQKDKASPKIYVRQINPKTTKMSTFWEDKLPFLAVLPRKCNL